MLVFAVTRVIFIPQGEFVAYRRADAGHAADRQGARHRVAAAGAGRRRGAASTLVAAAPRGSRRRVALQAAAHRSLLPRRWSSLPSPSGPRRASFPLLVQALLTLALVTPFGPLIYRLAYQSLADACVLVLLIVSVGVHFALTGLGLLFFGAEGFRNPSFWDARFSVGPLDAHAARR